MTDFEQNEICFLSDTAERKRWFNSASFAHPAKMVLGLQLYLIERYTKPGDVILDPMAGSGTLLVACALGRNVIAVELEDKFVKMMQDNWQKIKSLGPMLGYKMGQAQILQGDARNLDNVLADCAIFSPPYVTPAEVERKGMTKSRTKYNYGSKLKICGEHPNNISKLGERNYGKISAVISSPPYEEAVGRPRRKTLTPVMKEKYAGAVLPDEDSRQIGNLKSDNYLQAMLLVYQNCHRVLKDKGLMVLVVKNFIRNKKIIRLDLDTVKLCEQTGFTLIERLKRKLTQMSFWRQIYMQKFPDAPKIEFEDVLVFRK